MSIPEIQSTEIELYLAKIAGKSVTLPETQNTRAEKFLAKIAGENVVIPIDQRTRLELFLAKWAGSSVNLPADAPINRIEHYLLYILGESETKPEHPHTKLELYLDSIETGSYETETGVDQIVITAVAGMIRSLIETGVCTQASTPTPSNPVDIVCNNGALVVKDEDLPAGYRRVLGYSCDNDAMWQITGFKLRGSDTVRISFSITAACNVFGCYQGADANDNYDLYASTTSGSKYFRYGSGTYLSYFASADLGQRFDVIFTPTGSSGMPQDSTWSPLDFEAANNMLIGATTLTGTSAKLKGNLYGDIVVTNGGVERLHLVPCENNGVLGYYDTVGEAFYEPYTGFDGAVSLGYDGSHYELATVGTAEVLTVSGSGNTQTASAPNKLSADSIADEYDFISGVLTHKVGVWVLTGEETWSSASSNTGVYYLSSNYFPEDYGIVSRFTPICSHLNGVLSTISVSNMTANTIKMNNASKIVYVCVGADYTRDEWKAFIAEQYAAGKPIIILYPLETETTEQTTPHSLNTITGTNVISASASVSNIPLSVTYKA